MIEKNVFNFFFDGLILIGLSISFIKILAFLFSLKNTFRIKGVVSSISKQNKKSTLFSYRVKFSYQNKGKDMYLLHYKSPYLYRVGQELFLRVKQQKGKLNFFVDSFFGYWAIFYQWLFFFSLFAIGFLLSYTSGDIVFIVCLLFLLYSAVIILKFYSESRMEGTRFVKVTGYLIDVEESTDSENVVVYHPVISYENKKYSFVSTKSFYNKNSIPTKYDLEYDMNFPEFARLDNFWEKNTVLLFHIIVFLMSVIFIYLFMK
ncbi:MAG: hypothetical protein AAF901_09315 [Bacteroidota bacterium]